MCGICGIYQTKKIDEAELKEAVKKMNASQKNRGPDDEGVFSTFGALGHRRLSIIDLSKAGHQPMVFNVGKSDLPNIDANFRRSDFQKLVITYNGEIYNFLELRKELEKKGYKFKTKTDTEVILVLYAEYGEKSFSMLRGMFAFGLWDEKNKKLFLVKDRYGIKPLYYYADSEKLVFASTVKAIAESGIAPVVKNPDAYIGFLLFGSVPVPHTTIKNVHTLSAGYYLEINENLNIKEVQYYNPLEYFNMGTSDVPSIDDNIRTSDVFNIVKKTRELLEDSVKHHLISDAPLGIFLSGGLDSSALAALASQILGGSTSLRKLNLLKLNTLSIVFDEKEFSEEYYSDLVAQKISSDHCKIKITKKDFEESLDEIFEAMDQPTIDGVNTFFIAKAAKQVGLKTVLSGLGADEIFLGYPHFRKAKILRKIQNLPKFLKPSLDLASLFGGRYKKLSYLKNSDILSFYLGIRGLFAPQEAAKILDIDEKEVNDFIINMGKSDLPRGSTSQILTANSQEVEPRQINPVNLLSYLELKLYLQNQLLKDTDFMSMYHSVEVRVPFLDYPLVEYLSSLPPEVKLNMGKSDFPKLNKSLLVAAVHDLLPPEILTRKKMGFTFPFQRWFKELSKIPNSPSSEAEFLRRTGKFQIPHSKSHWSRFWAKVVLERFK